MLCRNCGISLGRGSKGPKGLSGVFCFDLAAYVSAYQTDQTGRSWELNAMADRRGEDGTRLYSPRGGIPDTPTTL